MFLTTLLLLSILVASSHAYFYVPNFMATLPFKGGMASARRNNSIILFGGENATNSFTDDLYQLTQLTDTFNWQRLPQTNTPPGNLYGQAIITNNNDAMYLLGGMTNTTNNQIAPLQIYQYTFDNHSWNAAPTNTAQVSTNSTSIPLNRKLFSATYDGQNKVYIYGGALNASAIFPDFYVLDLSTNQFAALPNPGIPRYSHTSSLLSNGQIVVIGGVALVTNNGTTDSILAPMNQIYVFDTKANQWNLKTATGQGSTLPSTRTAHSAVLTDDDRIIIFGGDNGANQRNKMYLNSISILDTKTWTWSSPKVDGIPPSRRSYASSALLNGKHLTVAFGEASNSYYNDINVFNIDSSSWLQSFTSSKSSSGSRASPGMIAGVTIAGVVILVIILFLLWKFQSYVRWFVKRVHHDIWKPRTGEPVWAETTRIVFQIFLLFIFAVFLAFVIRQAINSPNVTQTIQEASAQVQVPDVRFCFDGYPKYTPTDPRTPGVSCQTDNGYSCTQYIKELDMDTFQPVYADNLGDVNCYLFRAPTDFALTSTSGANNGSRLLFTFYGDQAINYGRIHTSVYPKQMNPNAVIYGINDTLTNLMSEAEVLNWQVNERNDIQATNVYDIKPFTYSALAYDLINHAYLQDVGWNYVGFLPITNSTPEVTSYFRQEAPNPNYASTHADLGVMAVFPNAYIVTVQREVKMYTLVNAIGFVGGVFGLLIAVQTCLFGYRPKSPWGVVHRWSIGDMKRSLLRGLQSKFKITDSGIPLVHPVHHRFSVTDLQGLDLDEPETKRINRVEERIQMLEMLFKAYYVDDEVFRSLDDASRVADEKNINAIRGHNIPSSTNAGAGGLGGYSPAATITQNEKNVNEAISSNNSVMSPSSGKSHGYPHSFSRQNTSESTSSNFPLTGGRVQHAPPYQPNTTFQMNDY